MARQEIQDKTNDLMQAFQDAVARYNDPVNHPTARWRDVEDARNDVVVHRSQLARAGLIGGDEKQQ